MPRGIPNKTIEEAPSFENLNDEQPIQTREEELEVKLDAKDAQIAHLSEEMKRLSSVVTQLAKKESLSTGEAKKVFFDMEVLIPFTRDGKRIATWERTGEYEENIGEATQKHYIYRVGFELKDGTMEYEESVPYKKLAGKFETSVKVPAMLPNAIKSVREGDHYVFRSVRALQGNPIAEDEDVEVVMGRFLADGKTKVYDGEKKTIKFYAKNV